MFEESNKLILNLISQDIEREKKIRKSLSSENCEIGRRIVFLKILNINTILFKY